MYVTIDPPILHTHILVIIALMYLLNRLHCLDASNDVDMMTNRLRTQGIDRAPASRPGSSAISNTIARLRSQRTGMWH